MASKRGQVQAADGTAVFVNVPKALVLLSIAVQLDYR
jgi:hypothetical protein